MKTLAEKPGADTDSRSAGLNRGRLHGGILIAMTLLTVAIVPSIIGRRTAGFAQRVDVPIVGDCLADFAWPTGDKPTIQGDVATQPGRSYLATSGGRVDCAQTGAGQVLSVAYDRPVATLDDQIALSSDSLCGSSLGAPGAVLGLPDWSYLDSHVEIAYYPAVFLRTRLVMPSLAAAQAGSKWVACIATRPDDDTEPIIIPKTAPTDLLGICYAQPQPEIDLDIGDVPCSEPHLMQVIGRAHKAGNGPADGDYERACAEYARLTIGPIGQTTIGRELLTAALNDSAWSQGPGACVVVSSDRSRTLSGSVIGLEDRPLPWSK